MEEAEESGDSQSDGGPLDWTWTSDMTALLVDLRGTMI